MDGHLEQAKSHFEKSLIALNQKDYAQAESELRQANRLAPNRASILTNLSAVLVHQQNWSEAITLCDKLLRLDPANVDGLINLGICHLNINNQDGALNYFNRAIEIDANYASAWANKGYALLELERFGESRICFQKALELNPRSEEALIGLGNVHCELQEYSQGLEYLSSALLINPLNEQAKWNKALSLLRVGNFAEGWKLYESRWGIKGMGEYARHQDLPLWLGASTLMGKTILVYSEQGYGDTIQMSRYLPLLEREMGANVIFEVPQPLVALMASLSPNIRVADSETVIKDKSHSSIDFQCPIMSMPLAFGTSVGSIPNNTPYLFSEPLRTERWQKILTRETFKDPCLPKPQLKVGIAWSGSGHYAGKKNLKRDIPIQEVLSILDGLNSRCIQIHCLQFPVSQGLKSKILKSRKLYFYNEEINDFADTAALISQLDLVISVDTSVAHLAGALNKPTVILLPDPPDFLSLSTGTKSLWYPSVNLIRQAKRGDWSSAVEKLFLLIDEKFL